MKEQHVPPILQEIAEDNVPKTVDVWPAIHARIMETGTAEHSRQTGLRIGTGRILIGVCVVIFLLAMGLPIAVLAAQGKIGFFGVTLVHDKPGTSPGITLSLPTPTPAPSNVRKGDVYCPDCRTSPVPVQLLSVTEAQTFVPFLIRVPTWLPDTFMPVRASIPRTASNKTDGPASVNMGFEHRPDVHGWISLDEIQGEQTGPYGIEARQAQQVKVNGHSAVFARGKWQTDPKTGHLPANQPSQWDDMANAGILAWAVDGITYVLRFEGVDLTRETMIRIAESIH